MRRGMAGVALVALAGLTAAAEPEYEMTTYQFALLKDGPRRGEVTGPEAEAIQEAHQDYLAGLMRTGEVLTMGPLDDAAPLRGVVVLEVPDTATAEALLAEDPWVRVGHLAAEIHPWWAARDILRRAERPTDLGAAWLGLLRRPADSPELPAERLEEIQRGHMANIQAMAASGDLVLAGPMGDDTALRGLLLFRTESEADIRRMVARDPAIQAGRLEVELVRWRLPKEALPPEPEVDSVGSHDGMSQALVKAVASTSRPAEDRSRDADRLPAAVLSFCGVGPGMRVAELMAGSGYYTEILARAVGPRGRLYAHNSPFVLDRYAEEPFSRRLARLDLEQVERITSDPSEPGLPAELDAVLLIRFYHDLYWMGVDRAAMNRAVGAALRPGGIYCVVDHHAEAGSGARDVESLHRVDAAMVRAEIEEAGFVLEAESDLLRHPEDDRTWNIFKDDGALRDRTDRFLYRFSRPAD